MILVRTHFEVVVRKLNELAGLRLITVAAVDEARASLKAAADKITAKEATMKRTVTVQYKNMELDSAEVRCVLTLLLCCSCAPTAVFRDFWDHEDKAFSLIAASSVNQDLL